ncbi:S8 family serine peptidase [Ruminococcus sp. FC2018]|uniref:S8 family serine peptidase n=1 Tax=Ruminococcus sp. FC2018 TaxID=1410617 RepID=UPI00048A7AD5|nr:S8 family serine peptidase [Ruminococcus sp. FC2018]
MKKLIIIIASAVAVAVGIGTFSFLHKGSDKPDKKVEDIGEIYCAPIDESHIASSGNGVYYADNEILIVAKPDVTKKDIKELAANYNAEVVGCIEKTGDYQLRLDNDDPQKLVDLITKETIIESASLNYIAELGTTNDNNDINTGNEWIADPVKEAFSSLDIRRSRAWGAQAINAPYAWKAMDLIKSRIKPVKVGLVDCGFDESHKDLKFARNGVFYNSEGQNGYTKEDVKKRQSPEHGTHVAGIMAADSKDSNGICGIYPYASDNLYGVNLDSKYAGNNNHRSIMFQKIALGELILRDVKVINESLGFNYYKQEIFFIEGTEKTNYQYLHSYISNNDFSDFENEASVLGDFLSRLLVKGYDFVLVSAAGNDSDRSIGHLESKYSSWLNLISAEKHKNVYDRIIVVGNMNEKYRAANSSNAGNRVDVFAPGEKIFSTLPDNKYGVKYGTSMASPHIAGICADIWSINNELTGAEVKSIVLRSHKDDKQIYTAPDKSSKYLADASIAVSLASTSQANHKQSSHNDYGAIYGYVTDASNGTDLIAIPDVAIRIYKRNGTDEIKLSINEHSNTSDVNGHFELILPEGEYIIRAEKDQKISDDQTVSVKAGEIKYVQWLNLKSPGNSDPAKQDELKKNIEKMSGGKIVLWAEADYDGDGKTELFVVVSKGGEIRDKSKIYNLDSIYFVNSKGEISQAKKFNGLDCYYDDSYQNTIDGLKFFSISLHAGTWSTTGYVFGVDADKFFEPSVSGKYSGFDFTKEGKAYAVERKIKDEGGGHIQTNHEMTFDKASKEFIILSDRGTDTKQAILPEGVVEFSGHYYMVFSNPDKYDAYKSEQACVEMGGHLVSINSQSEQDFIVGVLGSKDNYWIGLEKKNNSWHWIDGSDFSYTHWDVWKNSKGKEFWQPDNLENREYNARIAGKSVTYEDWYMNKGGWIDTDGSGKGEDLSTYGFICEWTDHPDAEKIKKYS